MDKTGLLRASKRLDGFNRACCQAIWNENMVVVEGRDRIARDTFSGKGGGNGRQKPNGIEIGVDRQFQPNPTIIKGRIRTRWCYMAITIPLSKGEHRIFVAAAFAIGPNARMAVYR